MEYMPKRHYDSRVVLGYQQRSTLNHCVEVVQR